MPVCRRCGEDKPPHKFSRKRRVDGSIWVGRTCNVCVGEGEARPPFLPAWPFRWWLQKRMAERYSHVPREPERGSKTPERRAGHMAMAEACAGPHVEPSTISRWFHNIFGDGEEPPRQWVELDSVDRVLLEEGSTLLWELVEQAEEHVLSNGFSATEKRRLLNQLEEWRAWA